VDEIMSLYDSILITGGGGMLGHALFDLLVARGHRPIAPTHQELDIADPSALKKAFADHKPSLVLNCAAFTKVDLCEQEKEKADAINGHAVGHLASLCRAAKSPLVHISTDFVFDGSLKRPYLPTDPVNPLSAYGKSKLLGEQELQKNPPARWLIVRTAWVYGRYGANFPRTMVQAAQAGKPLSVVNDQIGAPTYTVDLARAILDLLDTGATGLWHVTNSGQTSWYDFARAALQEFGIASEITPLTSGEWAKKRPNTAARPAYSLLDLQPLQRQIGRPMRPWREALSDYHHAVEGNGF
jgi:dTDP-4-dehydrorhamnose reductase